MLIILKIRSMKKYLVVIVALIATTFLVACDSDDFNEPNYVSFETGASNIQVDFGGSVSHEVKVYAGNVVGSDRMYEVNVIDSITSLGTEAFVIPTSVTIPGGTNEGVLTIEVSDNGISPNGETLGIGFTPGQNGFLGRDLTINVSQFCDPQLVFDFVFDGYASETSWQVEDSDGNVVLSGGGWADGTATASIGRCLGQGEYVLTVYDQYGDGMTYNGAEGSVTITYGGEEIGFVDGDFGSETSVSFTI